MHSAVFLKVLQVVSLQPACRLYVGDQARAETVVASKRGGALFAGHPTVGAAWWLRQRGPSRRSPQFRTSVVEVHYAGDLTTVEVLADWTSEFALHQLNSPALRYIRSRVFAPELDSHEDETAGAAAVPITGDLGRDLTITQGKDSVIYKSRRPRDWVALGGGVIHEGRSPIT